MPSYLVTGSSRGLGLGFVTELLKDKANTVVATARNTAASPGLQKLKSENASHLILIDLDVSKVESISAAAEKAAHALPSGLDNLISSAGVSYNALKSFEELDTKELVAELDFSVTSNLRVLRGFLPLVAKSQGKKIAVITSALGSIQNAPYTPGLANGYSVARAALNMLVRKWSPLLKNDGVTIALIHPGWSNSTEIGDGITAWMDTYAPTYERLDVETSAANTMKVVKGLTIDDAGAFFNHDGTPLPF